MNPCLHLPYPSLRRPLLPLRLLRRKRPQQRLVSLVVSRSRLLPSLVPIVVMVAVPLVRDLQGEVAVPVVITVVPVPVVITVVLAPVVITVVPVRKVLTAVHPVHKRLAIVARPVHHR